MALEVRMKAISMAYKKCRENRAWLSNNLHHLLIVSDSQRVNSRHGAITPLRLTAVELCVVTEWG